MDSLAEVVPVGVVADETPEPMPDLLCEDVAASFRIDGSVLFAYVEAVRSMKI